MKVERHTCPAAVCLLTWLAPEQSSVCNSKLACRQSTHSHIVKPMIQSGTRVFPAPVSSRLYTPGTANGEQMQGNRDAMPASRRQTAHHKPALYARQWPAVSQKHVRHLEGASPLKPAFPPYPIAHTGV